MSVKNKELRRQKCDDVAEVLRGHTHNRNTVPHRPAHLASNCCDTDRFETAELARALIETNSEHIVCHELCDDIFILCDHYVIKCDDINSLNPLIGTSWIVDIQCYPDLA